VLPCSKHVANTQSLVAKAAPWKISFCAARTASYHHYCSAFTGITTHTSTHAHPCQAIRWGSGNLRATLPVTPTVAPSPHTAISRHQQMG
jgi:hypothetical protein